MRPSSQSRWHWWLPGLVWAALIFALSSLPARAFPATPGMLARAHPDKIVHLGLYGILGWLWARALRHGHGLSLPVAVLTAILLASAYGASDEFHQRFVAGRSCDVWDWVADTAGGALAGWLFLRTQRASRNNAPPTVP